MVVVVQLVEYQFVVLVVVGSSPASHLKIIKKYAPLAQLVEHSTFNRVVTGSNPVWRTIKTYLCRFSSSGRATDL